MKFTLPRKDIRLLAAAFDTHLAFQLPGESAPLSRFERAMTLRSLFYRLMEYGDSFCEFPLTHADVTECLEALDSHEYWTAPLDDRRDGTASPNPRVQGLAARLRRQ